MKESSDLEPEVTEDILHAPGVDQVIDNDTNLHQLWISQMNLV